MLLLSRSYLQVAAVKCLNMENRTKYIPLLLILILFTFAAKANAQSTEIDTIYYYDRTREYSCIWLDNCIPEGRCQPLSVGFDLSPGFSFSLKELRVSFKAHGSFPYSIHQGIEWPSDSNKIYQDTIVVKTSERDTTGDSLIVYKSTFLEDKQELRNLTQKFWVVFDTKTQNVANTDISPPVFSAHSFYKSFTSASWDSIPCEWIVDAIVEKKTIGIKPDISPELISGFNLNQNYPNPFNPITLIEYELPLKSHVLLTVYNLIGHEIARLIDRELEAGAHHATWDASRFASGLYFYRLQSGNFVQTRKMMFLK